MPARLGAQHAGAGRAGAAQPVAARLLLLLQAVLPQQPAQAHQVRHQARERASAGGRAHAPGVTRFANLKVLYAYF